MEKERKVSLPPAGCSFYRSFLLSLLIAAHPRQQLKQKPILHNCGRLAQAETGSLLGHSRDAALPGTKQRHTPARESATHCCRVLGKQPQLRNRKAEVSQRLIRCPSKGDRAEASSITTSHFISVPISFNIVIFV